MAGSLRSKSMCCADWFLAVLPQAFEHLEHLVWEYEMSISLLFLLITEQSNQFRGHVVSLKPQVSN